MLMKGHCRVFQTQKYTKETNFIYKQIWKQRNIEPEKHVHVNTFVHRAGELVYDVGDS